MSEHIKYKCKNNLNATFKSILRSILILYNKKTWKKVEIINFIMLHNTI